MQKLFKYSILLFVLLLSSFISLIPVNALSYSAIRETSYRTQTLDENDEFLGVEMEHPERINLNADINFENYNQNEILKEELYSDELLYHSDYPIYESYDYKYIDKEATILKKGLELLDGTELNVNVSLNTEIEDLGNHKDVFITELNEEEKYIFYDSSTVDSYLDENIEQYSILFTEFKDIDNGVAKSYNSSVNFDGNGIIDFYFIADSIKTNYIYFGTTYSNSMMFKLDSTIKFFNGTSDTLQVLQSKEINTLYHFKIYYDFSQSTFDLYINETYYENLQYRGNPSLFNYIEITSTESEEDYSLFACLMLDSNLKGIEFTNIVEDNFVLELFVKSENTSLCMFDFYDELIDIPLFEINDSVIIIFYENLSIKIDYLFLTHLLFEFTLYTNDFTFYINGTELFNDKELFAFSEIYSNFNLKFVSLDIDNSKIWIDALCMYEYNEAIYPQGLFRNSEMFLNYTNNIEMQQSDNYGWNGRKFYSSANEQGIYFINMSKALNIEFYLHANATSSNFRFGISQLSPLSYSSAMLTIYAELFQVFQIEDKEILCNTSVIAYNYSEQLKINLECLFESNVVKLYVNDSYIAQMDAMITNFNLPNFFYIYDNTNNNNYLEITDLRIYRNSTVNYYDKYKVDYVDYDLEQKKALFIETNATANDLDYDLYANYYNRQIYNFSNSILIDNLQENQQKYEIWLDSFTNLFRFSFERLSVSNYKLGIFNLTEWNYQENYIESGYSERIILNVGFYTSNDLYTDSYAQLFIKIFDKNGLQIMNFTTANNSFNYQQNLRCKFISYQNSSITFNLYAIDSNYFLRYNESNSVDLAYHAYIEDFSSIRLIEIYYVEERSYQLFDNNILYHDLSYLKNEEFINPKQDSFESIEHTLTGNWTNSYSSLRNETIGLSKLRSLDLYAILLDNTAIHSFTHSIDKAGQDNSLSDVSFSLSDANTQFRIRIGSSNSYSINFNLINWLELTKDANYLTLNYTGYFGYYKNQKESMILRIALSTLSEIELLDEFKLSCNFPTLNQMYIRLSLGNKVIGATKLDSDINAMIYGSGISEYVWTKASQLFIQKKLYIECSNDLLLHSFVCNDFSSDITTSNINLNGIFYSDNFILLNPIIAVFDEFESNEWMYYRDLMYYKPKIDSFLPYNYNIEDFYLQKFRIIYTININVSSEYFKHYMYSDYYFYPLTENITISEFYNQSNPNFNFLAQIQYTDLNFTEITIEYQFVEYWIIGYEIEEKTFGNFLENAFIPIIILILFGIVGQKLGKTKGVIISLEASFIVLYIINRMSFISLMILSIIELFIIIYHIKNKGVDLK